MTKKEPLSPDTPFTDKEIESVEKVFSKLYNQPIHFQFRAKVRYMQKSHKKAIVALSSHYVGLFVPSQDGFYRLLGKGEEKVEEEKAEDVAKKLIHIMDITTLYLSYKESFVYFKVDTNVTCQGHQSTRFGQLLYRNIMFTFPNKEIEIQSDKKKKLLPTIMFESDDPDFNKGNKDEHKNIVASPSQKFQFAYFANSTHLRKPFNQEVVRYLHNLILSSNSIVDISQLPIELSSGSAFKDKKPDTKRPSSQENENGKNDDKEENNDNEQEPKEPKDDDDKKENDDNEQEPKEPKDDDDKKENDDNEQEPEDNDDENEDILRPIFLSLNQTDFIAGICACNLHKPDILKKAVDIISFNQKLRIIHFENCGATTGIKEISNAIDLKTEFKVAYWNLARNEKLNFNYFHNIITNSTYPIKYLNLAYCKIDAKITAKIFKALTDNEMMHDLQFLIYSGNDLNRQECSSSFRSFIEAINKKESKLKYVDFSSIKKDDITMVLEILNKYPSQQIETLILRKFDMDEPNPLTDLKLFIQQSKSLKKLDLSYMEVKQNTHENLSEIIKLIARNPDLTNFELCLNGLELHDENILILFRSFLTNPKSESSRDSLSRSQMTKSSGRRRNEENEHLGLSKWKSLSFNDNGMTSNDLKNLIPLFNRMKNLEELSFNGNFNDEMPNIKENLIELLSISAPKRNSISSPKLKKLSIAGTPGKTGNFLHEKACEILKELEKLDFCSQIVYLDVSNNHAGNRILDSIKSILHSKTMNVQTILFDGNSITNLDGLNKLADAADECKSLIAFPFPINDAKEMIKRKSGDRTLISELSEIQIKFIKATNKHRNELHIQDDLPFTADESVKKLVEGIMKDARKESNIGSKDYLKHHTKFCHVFQLPLPFQRMPSSGIVIQDESPIDQIELGETNIGKMDVYEKRFDDDPHFQNNKNIQDNTKFDDLAKFYIEKDQGRGYITTGAQPLTGDPYTNGGSDGENSNSENESDNKEGDGENNNSENESDNKEGDGDQDIKERKVPSEKESDDNEEQKKKIEDEDQKPKKRGDSSEEESEDDRNSKKKDKNKKRKKRRGEDSSEEESEENRKSRSKRKSEKRRRRQDDSSEEESEDDRKSRSKRKSEKRRRRQDDSSEEEYDDNRKSRSKRKNEKRRRRQDDSSEEEYDDNRKSRSKRKSEKRRRRQDDSSEEENPRRSKRKSQRRRQTDYSDDSNEYEDRRKSRNRRVSNKNRKSEASSDSEPVNLSSSSSKKRRSAANRRKQEESSSESWSDPKLHTRFNENSSDDYLRSSSSVKRRNPRSSRK